MLNPLIFFELDFEDVPADLPEVTMESLLRFLCWTGSSSDLEAFKARYSELTDASAPLQIVLA